MDSLIPLLQQLAPAVVFILGAPLLLLILLYVRKLLNKAGLEETAAIEALVEGVVMQGILFAEQEAAKLAAQGDEADSGTKMELATNFILAQIESLGLAQLAQDELVRRVEAAVGGLNSEIE